MKYLARVAIGVSALLAVTLLYPQQDDVFVVKPYLQLGDSPRLGVRDKLAVLWHAADQDEQWSVQYSTDPPSAWKNAESPAMHRVAVSTVVPHRVYQAVLPDLQPGAGFTYRIKRGEQVVFSASGHARRPASQDTRFVLFGDCAQDTPGQRAVAYQTWQAKPDYVFIAGDIVYGRGRVTEYRGKYFPIYNAESAGPSAGAPLLRSTLFIAAPGNHDIGNPDLTANPDGLAYFYYWSQPSNGPLGKIGEPNTPILKGELENQQSFLVGAAGTYPRMANFSFDYGNAHWTVLDSNPYVDWTRPDLQKWVEDDIKAAKSATWHIVAFHHPGFNSSKAHFNDQWMRVLSGLFERNGVDIVFSGHVHNYQRTFPLRFETKRNEDGSLVGPKGVVNGSWTLDKDYDGVKKTKPRGIIYITSGAGGANLYNPEQEDQPGTWQEFTGKMISTTHSFTLVDVKARQFAVRQIAADGRELDRFTISK